MAVNKKNSRAYGITSPLVDVFNSPIISSRVPTVKDTAPIGQIWVYQTATGTDDIYFLASVRANSSNWICGGGGSGSFDSLTVATTATIGTALTMTAGTLTVTSDDNSNAAIYIHANAGVNERIRLHADQGTAVDSILVDSDVGGVTVTSGLASADAININASNAAGGIDVDYGAGGMTVNGANGAFILQTGTGDILIGTDVTDHDVFIGDNSGVNAFSLFSGTGATVLSSTGDTRIDTVGVLELNSSVGVIGIGNDAINQNINLGTNGVRTVSIGNSNGATAVDIDCGTGNLTLGTNATAHVSTLGSTNTTSSTVIQAGSGGLSLVAAGIIDVPVITDTQAAAAVTVSANAGLGIFTGLTTAAAASQIFTITNTLCTATSAILCTMANLGANDAQMTITRVIPGAGSFTVTGTNYGAAALNGNVHITFWILQA